MKSIKYIYAILLVSCLLFSCQTEDTEEIVDISSLGLIDEKAYGDMEIIDTVIYNEEIYTMLEVLTDETLYDVYLNSSKMLDIDTKTLTMLSSTEKASSYISKLKSTISKTNHAFGLVVFYNNINLDNGDSSSDDVYAFYAQGNPSEGRGHTVKVNKMPSNFNNKASSMFLTGQPSDGHNSYVNVKMYQYQNLSHKIFDKLIRKNDPIYTYENFNSSRNNKMSSFKIILKNE